MREPCEGAEVTLTNEAGEEVGKQTTGEDGKYEFPGLPEGSYTITIRYPDKEEIGKEGVEVDGDGEDVNINATKSAALCKMKKTLP